MNPTPSLEEPLFQAALHLAAAARPAFLEQSCAGDSVLRQRLEALLAAHMAADGAMGTALDRTLPTIDLGLAGEPSLAEAVGQTLGRYKLLERIGEGGCGVVYVAEQTEPVRRRVALKVIKLGMDTKQVVARFEAERQALAMMDHPNIAKVLDAGTTEQGRPYFVMELVRGIRITDYCDQANLTTKERLDLFIKVCQAIQHAHQKGIIHRDIKPSNILVTLHDGVPVPKVIDFGIAKATEGRLTDNTVYTQLHQFIGTPAYMSPEQAEMSGLDIDTRSDIYSLGVLLYELLAGSTPFDPKELMASGLDAMRKTIREKEPVRPSTKLGQTLVAAKVTTRTPGGAEESASSRRRLQDLVGLIRGDLDWIVMKCLEKDRQRRYDTANGLAADLKRHLSNEPVTACPPSTAYKFGKAWKRNRLAYAAAAAITLALMVGIGVSTWQMVRARRAEQDARSQAVLAAQSRDHAESISAFMIEAFSRPDPSRDGRTVTIAETLDRAALKLEADSSMQPAQRAQLQDAVARTYQSLGLFAESIPLLEKVLAHAEESLGADHQETLRLRLRLAETYGYAGRSADSLRLCEEVFAFQSRILRSDHPERLRAMDQLAIAHLEVAGLTNAFQLRRESLALHQQAYGPQHSATLAAMWRLAESLRIAGLTEEALPILERLVPLVRQVWTLKDHRTLLAMSELATVHATLGNHKQALERRQEVFELSRQTLTAEHQETLYAKMRLAESYQAIGEAPRSLGLWEEVVAQCRTLLGPDHKYSLQAMTSLAISYHQVPGRRAEGLNLFEEVLERRRRVNGPEHFLTHLTMHLLANHYHDANRPDDALKMGKEVVAIRRRMIGSDHLETIWSMAGLAEFYERKGHPEEALKLRQEVFDRRGPLLGLSHPDTLLAMEKLAHSYRSAGRVDEADELMAARARIQGGKPGLNPQGENP